MFGLQTIPREINLLMGRFEITVALGTIKVRLGQRKERPIKVLERSNVHTVKSVPFACHAALVLQV